MTKIKIAVTDEQAKEQELIKTLNSNVFNKDSEDTSTGDLVGALEDTISETEIEPRGETPKEALDDLNNEAGVYGCGIEVVEDNVPNFNEIESDQQRWIKYDALSDKKGYADAGPSPVMDDSMTLNDLTPEAIEKLEKNVKPISKSYLERVEPDCLKDNEECRNTVNTELNSESGREIMNRSKEIADKLIAGKLIAGVVPSTPQKTLDNILSAYEMVDHPSHYNNYDIEAIEMIERIWGRENAALWCEITAFKYRLRMGTKPGEDITRDLNKEQWYLKKAKELRIKNKN